MKNNRKLRCLLLVSAILSPVVFSNSAFARVARQEPQEPQQEKPQELPQELPQARAVIDRFLEVTKGREVADARTSVHMTGTLTLSGMNIVGDLEFYAAKPSNLYTKVNLGPTIGVVERGCLGDVTWKAETMMDTGLLAGSEHYQTLQQADWRAALKDESKFESIKTLRREVFDKQDCYVLEFVAKAQKGQDVEKSKSLRTSLEYYAIATGYLVGVSSVEASPLGDSKSVAVISDYVEHGGSLMPMKTSVKGAMTKYEIRLKTIEFDKVDPAVFALPPAIQTLVDERAAKQAEAESKGGGEEGGK